MTKYAIKLIESTIRVYCDGKRLIWWLQSTESKLKKKTLGKTLMQPWREEITAKMRNFKTTNKNCNQKRWKRAWSGYKMEYFWKEVQIGCWCGIRKWNWSTSNTRVQNTKWRDISSDLLLYFPYSKRIRGRKLS